MNDEQLVSALITSYRNRGVDMSYLLTDPIFTKLPPKVQIQAIQDHAKELHKGVNSGMLKSDYKNLGANVAYSGLKGISMGLPIGAALSAASGGHGLSPLKAALLAAGAMGFSGAVIGGFGSLGGLGLRKEVKTSLRGVLDDPSPITALGVMSTPHTTADSRTFKEQILNRISKDISGVAEKNVPTYLQAIHGNILSQSE